MCILASSFLILINPKILRPVHKVLLRCQRPTVILVSMHETFPSPDTAYPVSLFDDGGFH